MRPARHLLREPVRGQAAEPRWAQLLHLEAAAIGAAAPIARSQKESGYRNAPERAPEGCSRSRTSSSCPTWRSAQCCPRRAEQKRRTPGRERSQILAASWPSVASRGGPVDALIGGAYDNGGVGAPSGYRSARLRTAHRQPRSLHNRAATARTQDQERQARPLPRADQTQPQIRPLHADHPAARQLHRQRQDRHQRFPVHRPARRQDARGRTLHADRHPSRWSDRRQPRQRCVPGQLLRLPPNS